MKTLIGKIVCFFARKHKRGRFVGFMEVPATEGEVLQPPLKMFACARCGRKKYYKAAIK